MWSPKKEKVFTKIETDYPAKIENSNVFSAQKQVVSKKKGLHQKLRIIFPPKSQILTFFQPKHRWSQKKKKKKRSSLKFRLIFQPKSEILMLFQAESRHVLHNFGTQFPLGGLFSIFQQKSASKAPKTCDFAYFTSQWRGLEPPPPPTPGYATGECPNFLETIVRKALKKTFVCPNICTNRVLKYTKCHISTNLLSFLKLCLPYCQKLFALAPTNR